MVQRRRMALAARWAEGAGRCGRRGRQDFPTRLLAPRRLAGRLPALRRAPHLKGAEALPSPPRALREVQARGLLGSRLPEPWGEVLSPPRERSTAQLSRGWREGKI